MKKSEILTWFMAITFVICGIIWEVAGMIDHHDTVIIGGNCLLGIGYLIMKSEN